ncbi:hypothetical protein [Novosphingobium sp.]|uniref:hypothetical protein n=1 Tax=Novosphingobium sp. TaxID=1874826 RepID=UPI003D0D3A50
MGILDSSAAWHSARRMVWANRDMLLAIAGVFFLLPMLGAALALPVPQITQGMSQQQMADVLTRFYTVSAPIALPLSLPMLVGYLTILAVFLDRDRPTVGTALMLALRLFPSYLVTQLVCALALSVLWVVVLGGLMVIVPQAIAVVISLLVMIYPLIRLMLIGPEMVTQRLLNPFRAIAAGIARSRRHVIGMALYFVPAVALFVVVYGLLMIVIGAALANVNQPEVQRMVSQVIAGIVVATGYTYFTAIVASAYQQLGPRPQVFNPSSPS